MTITIIESQQYEFLLSQDGAPNSINELLASSLVYTVSQKNTKRWIFVIITSANIDQFSKIFRCLISNEIFYIRFST